MTVADADTLYLALTRVHPRALQVLVARFVAKTEVGDGREQAAFASFYGVPEAAAQVLLWRAVGEFEAALNHRPAPTPLPFDEEQRQAKSLCSALERLPPPPGEVGAVVQTLFALRANAPAIRERLARAEQAELSSPEYARETWLRRVAIVVVLAVSAWFYWQADLTRWWRATMSVEANDAGR